MINKKFSCPSCGEVDVLTASATLIVCTNCSAEWGRINGCWIELYKEPKDIVIPDSYRCGHSFIDQEAKDKKTDLFSLNKIDCPECALEAMRQDFHFFCRTKYKKTHKPYSLSNIVINYLHITKKARDRYLRYGTK